MIDFGVVEVEPAGYVCRHGVGPEATRSEAFLACSSCLADLMNMRLVAPRTRSGRVWKASGRYLRGSGFRLNPQGVNISYTGGGGVRGIWRTLSELEAWTRLS